MLTRSIFIVLLTAASAARGVPPRETPAQAIVRLEARVAALERRVAALESRFAAGTIPGARAAANRGPGAGATIPGAGGPVDRHKWGRLLARGERERQATMKAVRNRITDLEAKARQWRLQHAGQRVAGRAAIRGVRVRVRNSPAGSSARRSVKRAPKAPQQAKIKVLRDELRRLRAVQGEYLPTLELVKGGMGVLRRTVTVVTVRGPHSAFVRLGRPAQQFTGPMTDSRKQWLELTSHLVKPTDVVIEGVATDGFTSAALISLDHVFRIERTARHGRQRVFVLTLLDPPATGRPKPVAAHDHGTASGL